MCVQGTGCGTSGGDAYTASTLGLGTGEHPIVFVERWHGASKLSTNVLTLAGPSAITPCGLRAIQQRLQSIHLELLIRVHFWQGHLAFANQVVKVVRHG